MSLEKATLLALKGDKGATPLGDPAVPVQFNPASLRMQLTNDTAGGQARGHQATQHVGTGSTQLTFDLHFDTADDGTDVRTLVAQVERFVLPSVPGSKQAPPRVQFHWGTFVFVGVITGLQEELDLFSAEGVPLRAKVGVTIRESDPQAAKAKTDATGAAATAPGAAAAAALGQAAVAAGDRAGTALGGESAAQFAARMGLDPSAWRGLGGAGLTSPLSLAAGLEIDFSSGLSAAAGVGAAAGVAAGAAAPIEQAFGLQSAAGGAGATAAGLALAAAGGVRAAVETVQSAKSEQAAAKERAAFTQATAAPPAATATRPSAPEQPRPPLAVAGRTAGPPPPAPPAPAPPRADPRAESFGFGVPLRPRVGGAAAERKGPYGGWIVVGTRPGRPERAPTVPARQVAHDCGCGCGGRCG